MVFSSILFLWVLFPAILVCCFASPRQARNGILMLFSLFFYAWGEPRYIFLMIFSVFLNYTFGILIEGGKSRRALLAVCIACNLLVLGYFKYANFLVDTVNLFLDGTGMTLAPVEVALPIGISFYTFQALSYVVDVYRGENRAQRNVINMMLYISFFPQLIAGPIVKYHDIETQLENRTVTVDGFSYGIRRFLFGLGKKVILANSFAEVVDTVWTFQPWEVSSSLLWFTALLYMMQIYFDFSGYSDMAIGLGRMFGFKFNENFLLPYGSDSVKEFWRRWHISLSGWFREYVYIPLGGNRKGVWKTYRNLAVVFLLTGIWHGAGWTFLLWGVYHGCFLILERAFLGTWLDRVKKHGWGRVLVHVYALLVVYFGWVLFRADTIGAAAEFIRGMFLPHDSIVTIGRFLNRKTVVLLLVAVLCCAPVPQWWEKRKGFKLAEGELTWPAMAGYMAILWLSLLLLINNTYNPFIYFRF